MKNRLSADEWNEHCRSLKERQEAGRNIFSKIAIDSESPSSTFAMASNAIRCISTFALEMGMHQLKVNHVRFFVQPLGYVSGAVDVDLTTGAIIRYSRSNDSKSKHSAGKVEFELFTVLKRVLNSDAFRQIPSTISSHGFDGVSYLIEANLEGIYSWKCHWCPYDQTFLKTIDMFAELMANMFPKIKPASVMSIESLPLFNSCARTKNMQPIGLNHFRLFSQSMGLVEWAVDIDTISGMLTRQAFKDTITGRFEGVVEMDQLASLIVMVNSDAFKDLPNEDTQLTDDAQIYLIEVDADESYAWKCHWSQEESIFQQIISLVECICRDVQAKYLQEKVGQQRAFVANSPSCMFFTILGYYLQLQCSFDEAMSNYKQALRLDPKNFAPLNGMAEVLLKQGKTEEAIKSYEESLAISPDHPASLYDLGFALEHVGRPAEANKYHETAIRISPDLAQRRFFYEGNKCLRRGNPQKAVCCYERVLSVRPEHTQVRFNLGRAFEQLNRVSEAIEQYACTVRIKPDFVRAALALKRLGVVGTIN